MIGAAVPSNNTRVLPTTLAKTLLTTDPPTSTAGPTPMPLIQTFSPGETAPGGELAAFFTAVITGRGIAITVRVTGMVAPTRALVEVMTIRPVYVPAARPEVTTEMANVAGVLLLACVTPSHPVAVPPTCAWAVIGTLPVPPAAVTARFCAAGAGRPTV